MSKRCECKKKTEEEVVGEIFSSLSTIENQLINRQDNLDCRMDKHEVLLRKLEDRMDDLDDDEEEDEEEEDNYSVQFRNNGIPLTREAMIRIMKGKE